MKFLQSFPESEPRVRTNPVKRGRHALIGLGVVLITTLTVFAVAMDKLLRPGAYPIEELRLEGKFHQLKPEAVQQAILSEMGDNYFSLDLSRIEKAVEDLPWVEEAKLRRTWPHGLNVWLREHVLVAQWGDSRWLNDNMRIVELDNSNSLNHLVILDGPDNRAREVWHRYQQWKPLLLEIGVEIESVSVDKRNSWTLGLKPNGALESTEVLLGIDDHDRRIERLIKSYPVLNSGGENLLVMDMRYPNGIAVTHGSKINEDDVALNEVDQ